MTSEPSKTRVLKAQGGKASTLSALSCFCRSDQNVTRKFAETQLHYAHEKDVAFSKMPTNLKVQVAELEQKSSAGK